MLSAPTADEPACGRRKKAEKRGVLACWRAISWTFLGKETTRKRPLFVANCGLSLSNWAKQKLDSGLVKGFRDEQSK